MLPAFIDEFVKTAMNAGFSRYNGGATDMAEVAVKRPDKTPQAYTQKNLPGSKTDPSIGAAQKNTPPPSVWGS